MHPYAYKESGTERGTERKGPEIWCGSEPIICTNLFGLIDATAARFVSSFWLPHKVAALWRAKKSIKHFNFSSCFSRREPSKKKEEETRATRVTGATMGTCQLCLSNAHFVFSFLFFLFCPEKVKVLPAHCPFQCPLILAYYYHTRCSSPPLGTVSRPRCPFKRETERDTFFHSRDNRIELSSVSVDIERIVPRGERESYPCNFPLSLWSTTPTPTPT